MAYMSQYIPGAESPENSKFANPRMDQFNKVLENDPKDDIATASIASIYFNQKKFDKAEEWNRKLIAIDPEEQGSLLHSGRHRLDQMAVRSIWQSATDKWA